MTMHEYLRGLPKVKWCGKCGRMVNKWHEHIASKHANGKAYPKGFEK